MLLDSVKHSLQFTQHNVTLLVLVVNLGGKIKAFERVGTVHLKSFV